MRCPPTRISYRTRRSRDGLPGDRDRRRMASRGGQERAAMAIPGMTARQVALDPMVDRAITMTAQMFGLSPAAVATLVLVALPLMARLADADPELGKRMHAAMHGTLPEPVPDFYVRLALNPSLRQSVVDDYKATYGHMLDAVRARRPARRGSPTAKRATSWRSSCRRSTTRWPTPPSWTATTTHSTLPNSSRRCPRERRAHRADPGGTNRRTARWSRSMPAWPPSGRRR